MDEQDFVAGKIERIKKEKEEREEIMSFLLDYCTEKMSKLWGVFRAGGIRTITDIFGENESLKALGLDENDLDILHQGLNRYCTERDMDYDELGKKVEEGVIRVDGKNYYESGNALYGLRGYKVELCRMPIEKARAEFLNSCVTGNYILIDGKTKIPETIVGRNFVSIKKLKNVCERFSKGECLSEIVKNTGLSLGTISGCLAKGGIIERKGTLLRRSVRMTG